MSCDTCKKVEVDAPNSEMLYRRSSSVVGISGRDGRVIPLDSCLVAKTRKPRGGWGVSIKIKGQIISVSGSSGKDVFNKVQDLLRLNGIILSDSDIWLNLNIQWLERAVEKFQMVSLSMLLDFASSTEQIKQADNKLSPSKWMSRVWSILEVYLSMSSYDYQQFLSLFQTVRSVSNPNISYVAGIGDIYILLTMEGNNITLDPIYEQAQARQWLVDIRNRISKQMGLPNVTFEHVSQQNHWK